LAGIETMIGLFINTLPVRMSLSPSEPLLPWLKRCQIQLTELRQYEHTPLTEIQRWSEVGGGQPLFSTMMAFESFPVARGPESSGGRPEALRLLDMHSAEKSNYPLNLAAAPREGLALSLAYYRDRFDDPTVARMLRHMEVLLDEMAGHLSGDPQQRLGDLEMLTASERHQLAVEWRAGVDGTEALVLELFAAQVAQAPDATALAAGEAVLSYAELDRRASQVARALRARGAGPDALVGLSSERSLEMVVGLLGILKAGAAYLPLDPAYPAERLAFILADAEPRLVLTQERLAGVLPVPRVTPKIGPADLAYVIYTSGSTGQPKGVLVTHRGLGNLAASQIAAFGVQPGSRVLQYASLNFDASIS